LLGTGQAGNTDQLWARLASMNQALFTFKPLFGPGTADSYMPLGKTIRR
jgi:hypothetical protein